MAIMNMRSEVSGPLANLNTKVNGSNAYLGGQVYVGPQKSKTITLKRGGRQFEVVSETAKVLDVKNSYFTDPTVESKWKKTLNKNGFGDVDPVKAQVMFDMAVDGAANWYEKSRGTRQITPEQYLGWYSKGTNKKAANVPTVQKYLYQPEQIQTIIDDALSNTLGRKPTTSESAEFQKAIKTMIEKGTTTTTKVVNGKRIVETTPGYSAEKAQALIEKTVKEQSPEDLQEKKSLDAFNLLNKWGG